MSKTQQSAAALILTFALTPAVLIAACEDPDAPDAQAELEQQPDTEDRAPGSILADGEERLGEGVTKIAEIKLGATRLLFLGHEMSGRSDLGLSLLEEQKPGGVPLSVEPRLASASALDIFLAVTGPEIEVPEALLTQRDHQLGSRGWFSAKVAQGEYVVPRASCVDSTFQNDLRTWQPGIDQNEKWLLNSSPPGTGWVGPHQPDLDGYQCSNCSSIWYDHLDGGTIFDINNVDANKQRIAICNIGTRPTIEIDGDDHDHIGPRVSFVYRTEDNANVVYPWSKDMAEADEGTAWRWQWVGDPTDGYNDYDWKIAVENAVDADLFDIGYIYDNYGW